MKKLTMYTVTHKPLSFLPDGRTPIFVGPGENTKGYLTDGTGENISARNKYYSELTAMYWIWKNDRTSDWVSLEHYRRFFSSGWLPRIIRPQEVRHYFKKYDVITSKLIGFKKSNNIDASYRVHHIGSDLDELQSVITKLKPEYLDDYQQVMASDVSALYNMCMMKKEIFDEYCAWLFPILFAVEEKIGGELSERDSYQQRVYGFLSERLLNVWLRHQKLAVKRLPVYYLNENTFISVAKTIKHRIFTDMY